MAAGTIYPKDLNSNSTSFVKTPALYDENLDEWIMAAANIVQTESGLFIYQKGTDDGRAKVDAQFSGNTLAEQLTNDDAVNNVLTFSANINSIEIFHNEASWQEFIVNGITLTIPSGGYRTPIGGTPGATVTIPAGVACIVGRLV